MSTLSSGSPMKEPWMTVDPVNVPTPSFGWYQPRYLCPQKKHEKHTLPNTFSHHVAHETQTEKGYQGKTPITPASTSVEGIPQGKKSVFSSHPPLLSNTSFFPPILQSLLLATSRENTMAAAATSSSSTPLVSSSSEEVTHAVQMMEKKVESVRESHPYVLFHSSLPQEHQWGGATGKGVTAGDWERVTPLEQLWSGPALSTKVPPASDYARLLASCTSSTEAKKEG